MVGKSLRGVAAALLIGTAMVAATSLALTGTAEAGVRPAVGKPLQAAIAAAKDGHGSEANSEIRKAEAVGGLTADEQRAISQTKEYVAVKTGSGGGGAVGAKAKFANDYNAGRYREVVGEDQDALRKNGGLDENSRLIVAQAYYLMGDLSSALRVLNGLGDGQQVMELKMAVAHKAGDSVAELDAARSLVLKGQTKFWAYLLSAADHATGLSDEDTLGIYRIRVLTGNMRSEDDYLTMAQIAIQLGYNAEALNVAQKGFDAKVLGNARDQRLLALAKTKAADEAVHLDQAAKAAHAAPGGDDLAHLSEVYWGMGKFQEAANAADEAIKKGNLKNPDRAYIAEGMADLGLKRGDASKAFKKAQSDPKHKVVADLWDVYARSGH